MHTITPPQIPSSMVAFAQAVADIAEQYGIDKFTIAMRPDFDTRMKMDRRIDGNLKVHFSASDGRGRPCRGLAISLESRLELVLESNPESVG